MKPSEPTGKPHRATCDCCGREFTTVRTRGVLLCGVCGRNPKGPDPLEEDPIRSPDDDRRSVLEQLEDDLL